MGHRGSWCGETHIQKGTFFLQNLLGVETEFEFVLYRHGPFSFDLRDDLSSMRADDLLELVTKREGYGPAYVPTRFSEVFLERFPKTTTRYERQVEFVAGELADKGVAELERLATAFFIVDTEGLDHVEDRATRLVQIKPHISLPEALSASREVSVLIKRSQPFSLWEESPVWA